MQEELICGWLGLAAGDWPPNHYALLGLEPGETDIALIEQQVHERVRLLRSYQLSNPEAVTAAMNRIAQAFTCLTDARTKKAYDAALLGVDAEEELTEAGPPLLELPDSLPHGTEEDPLAWLYGPWSQLALAPPPPGQVQADWRTAPPPPIREPDTTTVAEEPPPPTHPPDTSSAVADAAPADASAPSAPQESSPPALDPRMQAARTAPSARRGLGTKRALYYRIARTRQLIRAWVQIGKAVAQPKRRLTRMSDAAQFTTGLQTVLQLLRGFPPILGGVGQPGYFVVILAQQQMPVPTFRALVLRQREELARDWQDAHTLLLHHQQFLRQELRALRKKSALGRALRAMHAFANDQPGKFLLLLALLSLLLAIWLPRLLG